MKVQRSGPAVEVLSVLEAVGLAGKAFEAVSVNGVLEVSFGYGNEHLVAAIVGGGGPEVVETLERITENLLFFLQKVFDLQTRADAVCLWENIGFPVNVFWLHILSGMRQGRP